MSLFNSLSFEVRRRTESTYDVYGRLVAGNDKDKFTIEGTAQPTQGYAVKAMLEGKRVSGLIEVITSTNLQVADPVTLKDGDEVKYNDEWWTIIYKEPWQNGLIPHYSYILAKPREII